LHCTAFAPQIQLGFPVDIVRNTNLLTYLVTSVVCTLSPNCGPVYLSPFADQSLPNYVVICVGDCIVSDELASCRPTCYNIVGFWRTFSRQIVATTIGTAMMHVLCIVLCLILEDPWTGMFVNVTGNRYKSHCSHSTRSRLFVFVFYHVTV